MLVPTITTEEFQQLKATDIRTVDPSTVADIRSIKIDTALPPAERVRDVFRQMNGNPYVYRCGGILVKTTFSGSQSLQTVLESCLTHSK